MLEHPLIAQIRSQLHSFPPMATDTTPVLTPLSGIRAVMFDVYGTLLISGSGDVGTGAQPDHQFTAAEESLQTLGIESQVDGVAVVECLHATIKAAHERAHADEIVNPEIDIREIWQHVADELSFVVPAVEVGQGASWMERLSVEYELRVNPVWPMPGAIESVRLCQAAGHTLGIVSNAQFFTPLMWRAATNLSFEETGFDPLMQYFSYMHRRAKPGLALFQLAASALRQRGVLPSQTVYVGNDMRNDIAPAAAVGFRTALFAGDQQSLRLREDSPDLKELQPDVTLTHLKQLPTVLGI